MQSILDPAYYSKHTTAQPRVYRDRQGHMHDPDYRHFPSVSSYSSGSSSSSAYSTTTVEEEEEEIYIDPFSPQARRSSSLPPTPSSFYYSSPTPNPPSSPKPRKCGFRKPQQRHSMDSYDVHESDEEEEEEYLSEEEEEEDRGRPKLHDKSCSAQSVKRQLQSVSLSLSVSAFRARRKVKEALHHHRS